MNVGLFPVPRQFYEYEIRGRSVGRTRRGARCPLRSIIADTPAMLALHKAARELRIALFPAMIPARIKVYGAHTPASAREIALHHPRNYFTAKRQPGQCERCREPVKIFNACLRTE